MTKSHDIIVIGAALNGLAAALALAGNHVKRPLDVVVVDVKDPRAFSSNAFDGRASAITAAARRMFESLGIWQEVSQHAQAMGEIIVTDSAVPGGARPVLLQFGAEDMKGGPSSHMIENRFLYGAMLAEAEKSPHIRFCVGQAVQHYHFGPGLAAVTLAAFGADSAVRGATALALVQFALAGACAGFLPWNFPRARVFLGDAGSLLLGYSLGASAVLASFLA